MINIAASRLECLESACNLVRSSSLQRELAQCLHRLLSIGQLEACLERNFLSQRLVRSLGVIAQLSLDDGVDSYTRDQHDNDKEQIHAQQLYQERSTHKMLHGQYSSASSALDNLFI